MLTDDQIEEIAQRYLTEHYPVGFSILERAVKHDPSGIYYLPAAPRADECLIGDAGFFVNRRNGETYGFGTGCLWEGLDHWIRFFASGWRYGIYRVAIESAGDVERSAVVLVGVGAFYHFLELAHDTVWTQRREYDASLAAQRLCQAPVNFLVLGTRMPNLVPKLSSMGTVFEYQWVGHIRYDWHPSAYPPGHLGPQWD